MQYLVYIYASLFPNKVLVFLNGCFMLCNWVDSYAMAHTVLYIAKSIEFTNRKIVIVPNTSIKSICIPTKPMHANSFYKHCQSSKL